MSVLAGSAGVRFSRVIDVIGVIGDFRPARVGKKRLIKAIGYYNGGAHCPPWVPLAANRQQNAAARCDTERHNRRPAGAA